MWGRAGGDDEVGLDAGSGSLVCRYHTLGQDMPSPATVDDNVFFANGDRHAYGLNVVNGAVQWTSALPRIAAMASMTLDSGHLFTSVCSDQPSYHCETDAIDPRDGSIAWRAAGGGSDCSPAVADGTVIVNENEDDVSQYQFGGVDIVIALDEASGNIRWSYAAPSGPYTSVGSMERQIAGTIQDDVVYQSLSNADLVVALQLKNGRPLWTLRTWAPVKMSPVVTESEVLFGDVAGLFYRVDRTTGRVKHIAAFLKPFSTSPPVVVGNTVFVANGNAVYAKPIQDL